KPRRNRQHAPSIGVRREQAIGPRLETNLLADADGVVPGRMHFDEMLAITFTQHDFQPPRRPEAVDALYDAVERGSVGVRDNGNFVWPHEQARLAIREPTGIEIEPAPGKMDGAGVDGDWNRQRFADEVMHERALRPFIDIFRRPDLL